MRQRFDAENQQFDRTQRLKRAASGRPPSFDIGEAAAERAVKMERLRQQDQDLRRAEQGVRGRYADGKEFQSSQRLFDAEDVSLLPEAVLARHGRMAPSELVRTEKDRRRGDWSLEDDFSAGAALGSQKMMDAADEAAARPRSFELVEHNKAQRLREQIADDKARDRYARAKRVVDFDVAKARGKLQGAAVDSSLWAFGTGGTIRRGGQTFDVPMGLGQDRKAVGRAAQAPGALLPGMIDPASMPKPQVIDRRYSPSVSQSRTQATARATPVFDVEVEKPKQDLSGVSATELFAQATGAPASPGQPTVSVFEAAGEGTKRSVDAWRKETKGAIWNSKPTRSMYSGKTVEKDAKGRYITRR